MLLSVLCITFNHAAYIQNCIDGFLIQKTDFDFEIIIGDDASIDETVKLIEAYLPNPKIQFLKHPQNQGKSGINNLISVIKKSTGKYAILCEGDDYWTDPYKLQKQVNFLEDNQSYGGCFHNLSVIYENDTQKNQLYHPNYFQYFDINKYGKRIIVKDIISIGMGLVAGTNSLVYRNDVKICSYLENFTFGDRIIQFYTCFVHGPFHYINENMGAYRKHDGGSTATFNYLAFESDYISYYNWIDTITNRQYLFLTNKHRFEVLQACFIYYYSNKNKKDAVRLFKQIVSCSTNYTYPITLIKDVARLIRILF